VIIRRARGLSASRDPNRSLRRPQDLIKVLWIVCTQTYYTRNRQEQNHPGALVTNCPTVEMVPAATLPPSFSRRGRAHRSRLRHRDQPCFQAKESRLGEFIGSRRVARMDAVARCVRRPTPAPWSQWRPESMAKSHCDSWSWVEEGNRNFTRGLRLSRRSS